LGGSIRQAGPLCVLIERDLRHVLEPLPGFARFIPTGRYVINEDDALVKRYYTDVLSGTTINNTVHTLVEAQNAADSLSAPISQRSPELRRETT
jgi:hypothetical protein